MTLLEMPIDVEDHDQDPLADLRVALQPLCAEPHLLYELWDRIDADGRGITSQDFAEMVEEVTGCDCSVCDDCSRPEWRSEGIHVVTGAFACSACRDDYAFCEGCNEYHDDDDVTSVDDYGYCDSCLDQYCSWCEECEVHYRDRDSYLHDHDCCCIAPHLSFAFPTPEGSIAPDTRLHVQLPAGHVDPEGIFAVYAHLRDRLRTSVVPLDLGALLDAVQSIGGEWQNKRGNYCRRLSAAIHGRLGITLPHGLLSEVGNLARSHSSGGSEWWVEFTRDLNLPAEQFANSGSCWWGGESPSRCALKNWGGLAMRSYHSSSQPGGYPSGRAWVQPLDADLNPTHDACGAHAYLVYNCYAQLQEYVAARILAYLTSRTYRRVDTTLYPQYVNSNVGYLVADQATCDRTSEVHIEADAHATFDASPLAVAVAA